MHFYKYLYRIMGNENYKLFVYGSLRSGFRNPVYEYLTKYFHLLGEAVVKGKLYDLGEYPAAASTDEEKFISGELYSINNPLEFSWAIGQLDDYEGLSVIAPLNQYIQAACGSPF